MIYLRPASAYLRSSFPTSTVMDNEAHGWRNMLQQHGLHQLPLFDLFTRGGENGRVLRELDNQSWQNVNEVRLAASGRANYAIAKDDIGNWYVKSYGADASNIYQSALNLGAYASGGAFAPALLQSVKTNATTLPTATNVTASAPAAAFQKQFDSVMVDYTNAVLAAFTNLTESLSSLSNKVALEWSKSMGLQTNASASNSLIMTLTNLNFTADIDKASRQLKTNDLAGSAETQAVVLLKRLIEIEKQMADAITADDPKVVTSVRANADKIIRTFVTEQADKRRQIFGTSSTGLGVIQKGLIP